MLVDFNESIWIQVKESATTTILFLRSLKKPHRLGFGSPALGWLGGTAGLGSIFIGSAVASLFAKSLDRNFPTSL